MLIFNGTGFLFLGNFKIVYFLSASFILTIILVELKIEYYNIVQYSTLQYTTIQYNTVQYSTDIDKDINELKIKATNDELVNRRMENRLRNLEHEMNKSTELRKKTVTLKNTLTDHFKEPVKCVERNVMEKMKSGNIEECGEKEKKDVQRPATEVERMNGREEELKKHNNKEHMGTDEIEGDLRSSFRSDWARTMQEELERAGKMRTGMGRENRGVKQFRDKQDNIKKVQPVGRTEWEEDYERDRQDVPDRWEELIPKKPVRKIRKPPAFENWFGIETDSSDSSEDTEKVEWNEVERSKKNERKKLQQRKKRKETERMTALKASHMIGVGPVDRKLLDKRRKEGMSYIVAKELAVKDLLAEQLEYNTEELTELSLEETRFATNGDNMVYLAMSNMEQIKEIHVRKAELRNDTIQVRNYIPPNYYNRYTYLNKICKDKRTEDPDIKTQLRFGPKDIDIFIKYKSEGVPFKLVKIEDFTDANRVPGFDHSIKWKCFLDKPPRRKLGEHRQEDDSARKPSSYQGEE